MKISRPTAFSALLLISLACAGSVQAADPDPAVQNGIAEIGRINGVALACGHTDVVARAKGIIIARIAKTRAFGEIFETATNKSFQAQTADRATCPPRAELAVELETAALHLTVPPPNKFDKDAEAPTFGINPRYLLQAGNGHAITDSDFPNSFQLITFGYTSCPDICPTTLVDLSEVLKKLGDKAKQVQPLFVSLDPERDTLAVLRTYTAFFDTRILGATGSAELVRRAAENFKVRYEKVVDPSAPDRYSVDHTSGMYLLAPGGQFLARFPYGMPTADIVARIETEMQRTPERPGKANSTE